MRTELSNRIANRILASDNFENVAYVCCDWEEFVFEIAEWGVDHIAQVDFDDLDKDDVKALDEFIASFGCSQSNLTPVPNTLIQSLLNVLSLFVIIFDYATHTH